MIEIEEFFNKHKGETCFVLGNGPSLNAVDLAKLPYPTFGSNRIYLSGYTPTYYSCVNPLVLEQFKHEIAEIKSVKFLNQPHADEIGSVAIDTSSGVPFFGLPDQPIWEGHTVTYVLLQLAFYMGFGKVILLGVDHNYGDKALRPNIELVATGPDAYHFSPDYFSQGTRWHAPDLGRSELAYSLAKKAWEDDGRIIVNASASTNLTVFPLESLTRSLKVYPPRVSAIVSAYKCPVDWLKGTIDDIDTQIEDVEAVVVCQEGSAHHKLVQPYPLIKVVTTKDIPSVYRAWNLGAKAASGKYLTNCNTDDRRHKYSMRLLADVLDARPEVDVVYHDQYITWNDPKTFDEFLDELETSGERLVAGRFENKLGAFVWSDHSLDQISQGCYVGPQPMWRASMHQKYGYFLESYKSAGDYEFWLRTATENNMFHVPAILGVYCARLDGIEIGDPGLSTDETMRALMINAAPNGVAYTPMGNFIRCDLGGRWCFVDAGEFFGIMEKIRSKYEVK